jgi:hypothetical protein
VQMLDRHAGNISSLNPAMSGWQHGLPAGTAANSEALWSKGVQGEEGFRRDSCLQGPKSMAGWQHGLPAGTAANSEARLRTLMFR